MSIERTRYIPKGAIKVADKKSDAIAYLYTGKDAAGNPAPCARVFFGKQSKPVIAALFGSSRGMTGEQYRAKRIAELFAGRQEWAARKAARRADQVAAAKAGKVEVGAYFYTSWGYDQTNIDWYRVEKLIGSTMAQVVKVAAMDASKGDEAWMTGKSVPSETPIGQPFKVRLNGDGFKVDGHSAWRWDGKPKNWTAYA